MRFGWVIVALLAASLTACQPSGGRLTAHAMALAKQLVAINGTATMTAAQAQHNPALARVNAAHRQEFVDAAALAFAQTFTVGELQDQLSFYQSPGGRAVIDKTPQVGRLYIRNTMLVLDRYRTELGLPNSASKAP